MACKFKVATAAGTFDHFHKGHEQFLQASFERADTIYIGVTSDEFGKAKRQIDDLASFLDRKRSVEAFLKTNKLLERAQIIELHDIYGPTLEPDCPFEAIIITEKTRYGGELINKLRKQKGLSALAIEEVAYVNAQDGGDLSSSRIRSGEIDREGNVYIKPEWLQKDLQLPDSLRPSLQKPIGELIIGSEHDLNEAIELIKKKLHRRTQTPLGWPDGLPRGGAYVTVGDVVAKSFNEGHLPMDIAIVDYHVKRKETFKNLSEIGFAKKEPDATVENPKGTLTANVFRAVKETMKVNEDSPYVIRVVGEEDLVTLAVILAAPLGTYVFYGQPPYHSVQGKQNEGIVQVAVTEEKKAEIREIVSKFSPLWALYP